MYLRARARRVMSADKLKKVQPARNSLNCLTERGDVIDVELVCSGEDGIEKSEEGFGMSLDEGCSRNAMPLSEPTPGAFRSMRSLQGHGWVVDRLIIRLRNRASAKRVEYPDQLKWMISLPSANSNSVILFTSKLHHKTHLRHPRQRLSSLLSTRRF